MTARIEAHPLLDPIAFAGALVLAPLVIAALFFWLMLVPVFAVIFGALPYLTFGGPVFLWMVSRYPPAFGTYAIGGLSAHTLFVLCLAVSPVTQTVAGPANDFFDAEAFVMMALFGLPFSLAWGGTFGWLYRSFYRSQVRHFVH